VEYGVLPRPEMEEILSRWGVDGLEDYKTMFGGYSGSNYRVQARRGGEPFVGCMKVCHGYNEVEVAEQAGVQAFLHRVGFTGACGAIALNDGGYVTLTSEGKPAILLTFVEGKAADAVIESGVAANHVVRDVGANLAALHNLPVTEADGLRDYIQGGCCLLGEHAVGKCLAKIKGSEFTKDHPFLPFYETRLAVLQQCVSLEGLPSGLLHGDPFLDNVLVDPETGNFGGFVDFEDACVGPLVFDVGCAVIAGCFRSEDNQLDLGRVEALLEGYTSVRPLPAVEQENFVTFMMVAVMCNCSWRFMNFNIDNREIEECRNAYVELQQRIEALESKDVTDAVNAIVQKLCQ